VSVTLRPIRERGLAFRTAALTLAASSLLLACDSPSSSRGGPAVEASAAPKKDPEFVARPAGAPLQSFVQAELQRARAEGRRVLVYVGATWCEPCQRFHEAVQNGELNAELSGLRFLEFDRDRDGAELDAAGYGSRMIPLFVLPNADGTGSPLRIEGSIKGSEAVRKNLMPRLREMLAQAPAAER
jgi:thiol:disulfide interchange protein